MFPVGASPDEIWFTQPQQEYSYCIKAPLKARSVPKPQLCLERGGESLQGPGKNCCSLVNQGQVEAALK